MDLHSYNTQLSSPKDPVIRILLLAAFLYSHLSLECDEKCRLVFIQYLICCMVFHTGYIQQYLSHASARARMFVWIYKDSYLGVDKVVYNEDALIITAF
jgi:hypothetical protein